MTVNINFSVLSQAFIKQKCINFEFYFSCNFYLVNYFGFVKNKSSHHPHTIFSHENSLFHSICELRLRILRQKSQFNRNVFHTLTSIMFLCSLFSNKLVKVARSALFCSHDFFFFIRTISYKHAPVKCFQQ